MARIMDISTFYEAMGWERDSKICMLLTSRFNNKNRISNIGNWLKLWYPAIPRDEE